MSRDVDQPSTDLAQVRLEIEEIDRALIALIAQRVGIARRLGAAKRGAGLPTLDPAREAEVVRRAGSLAREFGLQPEEVREIFWHLIGLCRRAQTEGT
jgi:chorismate mutase